MKALTDNTSKSRDHGRSGLCALGMGDGWKDVTNAAVEGGSVVMAR